MRLLRLPCSVNQIILGGTHQEDDWSEEVRADDKKNILEGCAKLIPGCAVRAGALTFALVL